jgi:hypothetical protein
VRRIAGLVCTALLSCGPAAPPLLPAGIAELQLPEDAGTLGRIARDEEAGGTITRRRATLAAVAKQLLTTPPADPLVPELFDYLTALALRMEDGVVSPAWGSYLYTTYGQDLARDRPDGRPRRTRTEIDASLDRSIAYFHLRANPEAAAAQRQQQGFEDTRAWRNERTIGR